MSRLDETSMGGNAERFPSTCWSTIRQTQDATSPGTREALTGLCQLYWKPVYACIRARRGLSIEDAKDCTQAFFVELLEGNLLRRYSPERGTFRGYLRGAIQLFLLKRHRDASSLKKGGAHAILRMDAEQLASIEKTVTSVDASPDQLFEREWARSVISHAVSDLRDELDREGDLLQFTLFERYVLSPPTESQPTYEDLAGQSKTAVPEIKRKLQAARRRFRKLMMDRIREYVTDESEIAAELSGVLELLSKSPRSS